MIADVRMPYGAAKRTIATLPIGGVIYVRPEYLVTHHNAARRMGMRMASVAVQTNDGLMFRMVRVSDDITGHQACRLPSRSRITGRWLRSKLLTADLQGRRTSTTMKAPIRQVDTGDAILNGIVNPKGGKK